MAVCANGAVIYDSAPTASSRRGRCRQTSSASSPRSPPASSPARVSRSNGWAAARTTRRPRSSSAHRDTSTPGSTPTTPRCPLEDLLGAPAVKLLIRKAGARSADMAAALAEHVGLQGDITYSTNNGLIEVVPLGISKATGVEEVARPLGITRRGRGGVRRHAQRHPDAAVGRARRCDGQRASRGDRGGRRGDAPNADDGLARVLERWWQPDDRGPA